MTPSQLRTQLRFQLDQLSALNGQFEFESLCFWLAKTRISPNLLPATGPVVSGGDQGRDFETFCTYMRENVERAGYFTDWGDVGPIAFACSLNKNFAAKIKADVQKIFATGTRVSTVVFFSACDIPVANRHRIELWGREEYNLQVQIHDGQSIATLLCEPELWWIANEYLKIPEIVFASVESSKIARVRSESSISSARKAKKKIREARNIAIKSWSYNAVQISYYKTYIFRRGVPEGVGLLCLDERVVRDCFRFEYQRGKVRRVQAVGPHGRMFYNKIITYSEATQVEIHYRDDGLQELIFSDRLGRVLRIDEFTKSGGNTILRSENSLPELLPSVLSTESILTGANVAGTRANWVGYKTRISRFESHYNEKGRLIKSLNQDVFGAPAINRDGTWGQIYDYNSENNHVGTINLGPSGAPSIDEYGVESVVMTYGGTHMISAKEHLGADGLPVISEEGYARCEYTYDWLDRCIQCDYFDASMQRMTLPAGYSTVKYSFDQKGFLIDISFFDTYGNLTMQNEGYARRLLSVDSNGWYISIRYFDAAGAPCVSAAGYARLDSERDTNSNVTTERYFDVNGDAVAYKGIFEEFRSYDTQGRIVYTEFRDESGAKIANANGCAATELVYDNSDRILEIRYLDAHGKLTMMENPTRAAVSIRTYSEDGRSQSEQVFDADRRPIPSQYGLHEACVTYSPFGTPEVIRGFGVCGEPVLNIFGFHKTIFCFDPTGHIIEQAFYGIASEAVIRRDVGWHKMMAKYNHIGLLISEKYFDINCIPVVAIKGYAEARFQYDENGKRIKDEFFGPDGEFTFDVNGVAGIQYTFDLRGHIVEQVNRDSNGQACADKSGCAIMRAVYDDRNRIRTIRIFDKNDRAIENVHGYHQLNIVYDLHGNLVERQFFNASEEGVIATFSIVDAFGLPDSEKQQFGNVMYHASVSRTMFDVYQRLVALSTFAPNGAPISGIGDAHKVEFIYHENGAYGGMNFFDIQGLPCMSLFGFASNQFTYNNLGQVVEVKYFDAGGRSATQLDLALGVAYAGLRYTYDQKAKQCRYDLLDSEFQVPSDVSIVASVETTFDALGNEIEIRTFGVGRVLVNSALGFAIRRMEYDIFGNIVKQQYYNQDGNVISLGDGVYGMIYKSNFAGQTVETAYIDKSGAVTTDIHGVAKQQSILSISGLEVERCFLGLDGRLVDAPGGYARCVVSYNEVGFTESRKYYSSENVLMINPSLGVAQEYWTYDAQRRLLEVRSLDTEDKLCNDGSGVALRVTDYSERGSECRCFNSLGQPTNCSSGWASWTVTHGKNAGQHTQQVFDVSGNVLIGALRIKSFHSINAIDHTDLQVGDVILRLGDWSISKHGKFIFDWRLLHFNAVRACCYFPQPSVILRGIDVIRGIYTSGPKAFTLDDIYISRNYLELSD